MSEQLSTDATGLVVAGLPPAVSRLGELKPEDILRQAALWDEVDVGRELLSIAEDRAAGRHTGSTLERREELYDAICMRLAEGVSVRRIARAYGVGRNTLAVIRERLVQGGKMEPYKKRMAGKFAEVIEAGTDLLLERLERGDVPTNVLPVVVGVFVDKKALGDGEPTVVLGIEDKREFSQAAWEDWVAKLPQAQGSDRTVDGQSTGGATNDQ